MSDWADYPEDWLELGWCCRDCGIFAWNGLSDEVKRELSISRTDAHHQDSS